MHSVRISRNSWEPIRLKKCFKVIFQRRHHLDCTISTYIAYTTNFLRLYSEEYVKQKERLLTWILCSFWERSSCVCRASCSSLSLRAPNVYIQEYSYSQHQYATRLTIESNQLPKRWAITEQEKIHQQVCKRNMQYIWYFTFHTPFDALPFSAQASLHIDIPCTSFAGALYMEMY